jgi:hypothetical protein
MEPELNWMPVHDMMAAIDLLHELLPRDVSDIAARYIDDRRGINAIRKVTRWEPLRMIRINPYVRHETDSLESALDHGDVTVYFTDPKYRRQSLCSHRITWKDEAIWDFACGDGAPELEQVLHLHAQDDLDMDVWMRDVRDTLRREIIALCM